MVYWLERNFIYPCKRKTVVLNQLKKSKNPRIKESKNQRIKDGAEQTSSVKPYSRTPKNSQNIWNQEFFFTAPSVKTCMSVAAISQHPTFINSWGVSRFFRGFSSRNFSFHSSSPLIGRATVNLFATISISSLNVT
jgi:hypothetical protein